MLHYKSISYSNSFLELLKIFHQFNCHAFKKSLVNLENEYINNFNIKCLTIFHYDTIKEINGDDLLVKFVVTYAAIRTFNKITVLAKGHQVVQLYINQCSSTLGISVRCNKSE